jgi:VIT1/CCC1 family predicted Fe2+/Mn2+ transporter
MLTFAAGAFAPVAPFLLLSGPSAILASIATGGAGLFCAGAAISVFTGRSLLLSGGRQLLLGLAAAGATYGVGHLIGVAVMA